MAFARLRRQENLELGPDSRLSGDFNPAVVLLDDAIDCRQSQTHALAYRFGREERLEKVW